MAVHVVESQLHHSTFGILLGSIEFAGLPFEEFEPRWRSTQRRLQAPAADLADRLAAGQVPGAGAVALRLVLEATLQRPSADGLVGAAARALAQESDPETRRQLAWALFLSSRAAFEQRSLSCERRGELLAALEGFSRSSGVVGDGWARLAVEQVRTMRICHAEPSAEQLAALDSSLAAAGASEASLALQELRDLLASPSPAYFPLSGDLRRRLASLPGATTPR
jgi:hypothetical protein